MIRCMIILYATCHLRHRNLHATQPLPLKQPGVVGSELITKGQGPRREVWWGGKARVGGSWGALIQPGVRKAHRQSWRLGRVLMSWGCWSCPCVQKHTGETESVAPLKNSQCYDPGHPSGLGVGSGKGGWNRNGEGGLQKGLFAHSGWDFVW